MLNRIRAVATCDLNLRIEDPFQVSLFVYDNGTSVVESFLPDPVLIRVMADLPEITLTDLQSNGSIPGPLRTWTFEHDSLQSVYLPDE